MTQSIKEKLREIALEFRRKPYPISDFISLLNKAADALDEKDKMQVEIEKLRQLASTCYAGLGGECNLPEAWLDVLNKAANGEDFSTEGLLPYQNQDAHRISLLINAIGKAAAEAGIYNEQVPLTGPLALMLAEDLGVREKSKYVEAQWQARARGSKEWINVYPTSREPTQEIRAKYLESIRSNAGNQVYEIRVLYEKVE